MHSEEAGNTLAGPGREHIISEDGRGWNKRWVWSSRVTYSVCVKLRGGASVVEMEWIWGVNAKRTEIDAEGASISTSTCCFNKTQGGNRALSRKKKKKKKASLLWSISVLTATTLESDPVRGCKGIDSKLFLECVYTEKWLLVQTRRHTHTCPFKGNEGGRLLCSGETFFLNLPLHHISDKILYFYSTAFIW